MLEWSNKFKDRSVKHFLPCKINETFDIIGVWTCQNNSPNFGYIGQLWKYLQINKQRLYNCILIGDFNSNTRWDQWDRWWNHSDVVNELEEIGIESFYHKFTNEFSGKESKPTLYFQKKSSKAFHIDYVFGSQIFIKGMINFEIGEFDMWIKISDHMPIICEIAY